MPLWSLHPYLPRCYAVNSLRPRLNRRSLADDIFKCIFLNENEWISPTISLKFVPKVRINNIPALVQIMAWCLSGSKPLSEPMMVSLLTHICIIRPQWVNEHNICLHNCKYVYYKCWNSKIVWYFSWNLDLLALLALAISDMTALLIIAKQTIVTLVENINLNLPTYWYSNI